MHKTKVERIIIMIVFLSVNIFKHVNQVSVNLKNI